MNFKRFGRTANLFDKDNDFYSETASINIQYSQWVTYENSACVKIPCEGNKTYTLSVSTSLPLFRIAETNNINIQPQSTPVDIVANLNNATEYTFTTLNDTEAIIFQGSYSLRETWKNELMFNEGSTALPYQPYKDWSDIPYYQHKTATDTLTLPAVIYPNDTSITVGLKGNEEHTGTPSPSSPVTPNGTGDKTANLFDKNSNTTNNNGYTRPGVEVSAGTYSIDNGTPHHVYYRIGYSGVAQQTNPGMKTEGIVASDSLYVWRDANIREDGVMLNTGSEAFPYEPYGYKIPISSANTTTTVYLGEVQTTRRIRKYTFTGNETTFSCAATTDGQNYCVAYRFIDFGMTDIKDFDKMMQDIDYPIFISSHFGEKPNTNSDFNDIQPNQVGANSVNAASNRYIIFCVSGLTTAAEYSAWFAQQYANGTPVEVYYILETETTGIVNEPLMKIGDYADTVSGITIPTITGKDSFDVETTLKPSEVSLSYTGWHDATIQEWDGSQWNE